MNKTKKNNKGFSLVELIVVVLIMAIIAVALAPQVMKWVDNSKIATDVSTYDSLVASCQLALTDSETYSAVKGITNLQVTLEDDGVKFANDTSSDAFKTQLQEILGSDFDSKTKSKTGTTYTITINKGTVERTSSPDGSSVS